MIRVTIHGTNAATIHTSRGDVLCSYGTPVAVRRVGRRWETKSGLTQTSAVHVGKYAQRGLDANDLEYARNLAYVVNGEEG